MTLIRKARELINVVDIIVGRNRLKEGERLNTVELKQNERAFQFMDKAGMVKEIQNVKLLETLIHDISSMSREGPLKNGETGRIVALDGSVALMELKQGAKVIRHAVNLSSSRHWDYAYASTVHAAQGATQYRTLFHIRTPDRDHEHESELKTMAKVFGDRSFYVGSTRATHEMKIYTNNKQTALEIVTARQDKSSAIELLGIARQKTRGVER